MRQCPECRRTYDDDTLSFCLEDGAPLSAAYDEGATWVGPSPVAGQQTKGRNKPARKSTQPGPKRSGNKQDEVRPARAQTTEAMSLREERTALEVSNTVWWTASLLTLAGAAFIRLYELGLKPLHHDEGVNGFFLTNLYRNGVYHYDPNNYHGPTLYYFALAVAKVNALVFGQDAGLNTIAVRLVPVIFGVGTVWLVLCLRSRLGTVGALSAAALVAVSPGSVFFSRYFIHETHFVFFTLGLVVASLNYYDRKRPTIVAWGALILVLLVIFIPSVQSLLLYLLPSTMHLFRSVNIPLALSLSVVLGAGITLAAVYVMLSNDEGRPVYQLLAFASAAFLFATKETAIISVGVLVLAFGVAAAYIHLLGRKVDETLERSRQPKKKKKKRKNARREGLFTRFGGAEKFAAWTLTGFVLFVLINIIFYSSFYTYREGLPAALESLQVWAQTGTKEHAHNWYTYFIWLWQEEAPLLLLGTAGAVVALVRRNDRFTIFAGAWAFGMLAAYSLIPYKTPWLVLSFTIPLAIVGGYAIGELYNFAEDFTLRAAAAGALAVALTVSITQSVLLNFYFYDDEKYPYVYAHTRREFVAMVNEIERLARAAGTDKQTQVTVIAPEYWPLPWYLRDYPHADFWGKVEDDGGRLVGPFGPIVVSSDRQELEQAELLQAALGDRYERVGSYPMRPGVTLVLYASKDLPP